MNSFVALYQRRGTMLLVLSALLLTALLALERYLPLSVSSAPVGAPHEGVLAQAVSMLVWLTLVLFVGAIWARSLFASVTLSEVYVIGAALGAALLPLAVFVGILLVKGAAPFITLTLDIVGREQSYILSAVFALMLIGVLALIGKEVVRAARRPV